MASILVAKREELDARRKGLHAIFEEAGPELDLSKVKSLEGDTTTKAAEIKRRNTELTALGAEIEELAMVEKAAGDLNAALERKGRENGDGARKGDEPAAEAKSLGQLFVESATYKSRMGNRGPASEVSGVDLKTLMTTAAGWAPESIRKPGYVPSAQAQPTIIDLLPFNTTTQAAVVYMEETTYTNNAAARAEGANNAGEAALALTQRTSNVVEFAVWIPVTREQMDDVVYIQGYINNRLPLMLRQVVNAAIMSGAGAPSLTGLIGMGGVQTQALGADPVMDCIYKGIVLGQIVGMANPNAIAMHPLDWQDIRLARTLDGIYIMGSPSEPGPARLWGLPVVTDAAVTQNTAVVGDFATFIEFVQKQGIVFEYSDSHAGLFIQRTLAVLASIRAAVPVYRPAAFVQCTGI